MTAVANPPVHSTTWQNVISSNLEEQLVDQFLSQFAFLIEQDTIPAAKHVQILLHLVLHPHPSRREHLPATHTPLDLLYKLLSMHSARLIARQMPRAPRTAADKDEPAYLRWEARGTVERDAKRTMRRCASEGIWALLWDQDTSRISPGQKSKGKGKKRALERADRGEEEEEFEGGDADRRVSENGWALLEWFIDLWEEDRSEQTEVQASYSPLFLEQLPHDRPELPIDNASAPLAIVRAAFQPTDTLDHAASSRRQRSAVAILQLLFAAALAPGPPLHPHSLLISTLYLVHILSSAAVDILFSQLAMAPEHSLPQHVLSHLYATIIEDLAGVRVARAEARRRHSRRGDFESLHSVFPAPTLKYAFELLAEKNSPEHENEEDVRKAVAMKTRLLASMIQSHPLGSPIWKQTVDSLSGRWRDQLEASTTFPSSGSLGRGLVAMVDVVCPVAK